MEISKKDARNFMENVVSVITLIRNLNEAAERTMDARLGIFDLTEGREINICNLREIAIALGIEYETVPYNSRYHKSKTIVQCGGYTFSDLEVEECDAGDD